MSKSQLPSLYEKWLARKNAKKASSDNGLSSNTRSQDINSGCIRGYPSLRRLDSGDSQSDGRYNQDSQDFRGSEEYSQDYRFSSSQENRPSSNLLSNSRDFRWTSSQDNSRSNSEEFRLSNSQSFRRSNSQDRLLPSSQSFRRTNSEDCMLLNGPDFGRSKSQDRIVSINREQRSCNSIDNFNDGQRFRLTDKPDSKLVSDSDRSLTLKPERRPLTFANQQDCRMTDRSMTAETSSHSLMSEKQNSEELSQICRSENDPEHDFTKPAPVKGSSFFEARHAFNKSSMEEERRRKQLEQMQKMEEEFKKFENERKEKDEEIRKNLQEHQSQVSSGLESLHSNLQDMQTNLQDTQEHSITETARKFTEVAAQQQSKLEKVLEECLSKINSTADYQQKLTQKEEEVKCLRLELDQIHKSDEQNWKNKLDKNLESSSASINTNLENIIVSLNDIKGVKKDNFQETKQKLHKLEEDTIQIRNIVTSLTDVLNEGKETARKMISNFQSECCDFKIDQSEFKEKLIQTVRDGLKARFQQFEDRLRQQMEDRFTQHLGDRFTKKIGERFTQQIGDRFTQHIEDRFTQHLGDRFTQQIGDRFTQQIGDKFNQQIGDRFTQQIEDRFTQQFGDRFTQQIGDRFTKHLGDRFTQQIGDRFTQHIEDRFTQQIGDRFTQQIGDRFTQQIGDRFTQQIEDRFTQNLGDIFTQHLGDRFNQQIGDRFTQQIGYRFTQQIGERFTQQIGERFTNQIRDRMTQQIGDRMTQQIGDRLVQQIGDQMTQQLGDRMTKQIGDRMTKQIGDRMTQQIGDRMTQQIGDRFSQQMQDRVSHNVQTMIQNFNQETVKSIKEEMTKLLASITGFVKREERLNSQIMKKPDSTPNLQACNVRNTGKKTDKFSLCPTENQENLQNMDILSQHNFKPTSSQISKVQSYALKSFEEEERSCNQSLKIRRPFPRPLPYISPFRRPDTPSYPTSTHPSPVAKVRPFQHISDQSGRSDNLVQPMSNIPAPQRRASENEQMMANPDPTPQIDFRQPSQSKTKRKSHGWTRPRTKQNKNNELVALQQVVTSIRRYKGCSSQFADQESVNYRIKSRSDQSSATPDSQLNQMRDTTSQLFTSRVTTSPMFTPRRSQRLRTYSRQQTSVFQETRKQSPVKGGDDLSDDSDKMSETSSPCITVSELMGFSPCNQDFTSNGRFTGSRKITQDCQQTREYESSPTKTLLSLMSDE